LELAAKSLEATQDKGVRGTLTTHVDVEPPIGMRRNVKFATAHCISRRPFGSVNHRGRIRAEERKETNLQQTLRKLSRRSIYKSRNIL
jgi:hypothetical protein